MRIIPGVAMLVRPNIRVVVTGDIESATACPRRARGRPRAASSVAPPGQSSKFEAEQLIATVAVAF